MKMISYNFKFALLLLLHIAVGVYSFEQYKGYKIYEIIPRSRADSDFIYHLSQIQNEIDVLHLTKIPNDPARVLVAPRHIEPFETILNIKNLQYEIIVHDISKIISYEKPVNHFGRTNKKSMLEHFFTNAEINEYLQSLAVQYSNRVTVEPIGKSYEGRPINAIRITNGVDTKKKAIFVDAGIHAREWIAPSTALYTIHQLVENFEQNQHLLEEYDWIIVPIVNVDGYEYSHHKQRLWRKTRKPSSSSCYGVDGNRNFDFHWGETGASSQPCSDTYKGQTAFSEPETQAIRDALLSLTGSGKMYLTLHSYGNLLLYPWGYTSSLPDNWKDLDEVCKAGANAIRAATGSRYTVGSSTNVLYAAAGGSDDYALAVADFPISVTMELPSGGYGFEPKPSQIKQIVTESWVGIKAMAEKVIEKY